ncbi:hypothetical protein JQX13_16720 [Archangium violaceum]|uniref:hypothetical protein n=1 Tax=Archangium violaceum TaxID=83451 RepID=UPI00193B20CE|nr:hypothetical protein [Archangium violaceum]QRK11567.1 hypothetical protein JQX13_16720 [Archangium violaceum]
MTKTKLLLAGLLTGAVAFGTACKTDQGTANTGTGTDTTIMTQDAGTGGAGVDTLPEEGTREMEPGAHGGYPTPSTNPAEPGTGGTGLEPESMDNTDRLGGETSDEPLNPGAPANQPSPESDMTDTDEDNKSLR